MNVERLEILAKHFDQIAADKKRRRTLNMGRWANIRDGNGEPLRADPAVCFKGDPIRSEEYDDDQTQHTVVLKEGYCGTVACVAGHATSNKELREQGLHMLMIYDSRDIDINGAYSPEDFGVAILNEDGEVIDEGTSALAAFFGIDFREAHIMFGAGRDAIHFYTGDGDSYEQPTPEQVAKRIRQYIAGRTDVSVGPE